MSGASTSYLSLAGSVDAEIEIKRSRFLAHLAPAEDEAAARAVVEEARRRHHDARHHCSAFILGAPGTAEATERSSDDGEPSGTAGAPVLEVLRGSGLRDVVAVVTRWFGGTLLGAGGLVRAYSEAVQVGLGSARLVRRDLLQEFALSLDYAEAGRVEGALRARGVQVLDTRYAARATLILGLAAAEQDRLRGVVAELTAGTGTLRPCGRRWVDSPAGTAPDLSGRG